jgi:hypothetical protein
MTRAVARQFCRAYLYRETYPLGKLPSCPASAKQSLPSRRAPLGPHAIRRERTPPAPIAGNVCVSMSHYRTVFWAVTSRSIRYVVHTPLQRILFSPVSVGALRPASARRQGRTLLPCAKIHLRSRIPPRQQRPETSRDPNLWLPFPLAPAVCLVDHPSCRGWCPLVPSLVAAT